VDIKNEARNLFTASDLEAKRVKTPHADPRAITEFKDIESIISHSLRKPNLIRTQTLTGVALPTPKLENRGLQDEALLKKLLQYRSQVPGGNSRIIRKREP
jgi:hypothetical protein